MSFPLRQKKEAILIWQTCHSNPKYEEAHLALEFTSGRVAVNKNINQIYKQMILYLKPLGQQNKLKTEHFDILLAYEAGVGNKLANRHRAT